MIQSRDAELTAYLESMVQGSDEARGLVWARVYDELREMAGRLMAGERADHTLQPTALVHEAYARLLGGAAIGKADRAYFFAAAAQAMRRILIEHARARLGGGGAAAESEEDDARGRVRGCDPRLLEAFAVAGEPLTVQGIEALDAAIDALGAHDARTRDVIMLRFFAGLSVEQTAEVLEISPRTVKRCWAYGRTWLYRRIEAPADWSLAEPPADGI